MGVVTNGHKVYFGTDYDAVVNATPTNPMGVYKGAYDVNHFNPGTLSIPGVQYYWRVDEQTASATYKGYVWGILVLFADQLLKLLKAMQIRRH